MSLIILGALGDFVALGFAPQTLVASLSGGTTIFANVVFAHFWLKQPLYFTDLLGVALVTVGVVVCAVASSAEGDYTLTDLKGLMIAPRFVVYAILSALFIMIMLLRIRRSKVPVVQKAPTPPVDEPISDPETPTRSASHDIENESFENEAESPPGEKEKEFVIIDHKFPLYWAAISGTIGAQSVLLAKCVMEMIVETIGGDNQFKYFGTYVLVGGMTTTLLTQTHTLNLATMHGDTMSTFPVFQAFWIGFSNISGIVLLPRRIRYAFGNNCAA